MTDLTTGELADRVIAGQRLVTDMRTSAGLRHGAATLTECVERLGCRDLFPASTDAHTLAAVAVAMNESLRVVTLADITGAHIDKVVVVEAVAISGIKVRRAVDAVRRAGASWVSAAVLTDLNPQTGAHERFGVLDALATAS